MDLFLRSNVFFKTLLYISSIKCRLTWNKLIRKFVLYGVNITLQLAE